MTIWNRLVLFYIFKLQLTLPVLTVPVDNGVIDDPYVKCGDMSLDIEFKTKNPFTGHVFVQGHYGEPGCRMDATSKNEVSIQLAFNSCGVKRARSANPRGIFITAAVIITFHEQFITKVDKSYVIQCFYMEAEKIVTAELEVSMLTTSFQTQTVPMPTCRYEVLDNGPTGNPVRFAKIGDQVYHKWTCDTATSEVFCMVVHSCKVDDGAGNIVSILDASGCALDKYLLGNLDYLTDLMAGRESHVFKYADRPSLFFKCQISIVIKEPGFPCPRPVCQIPARGKRDSNRQISNAHQNHSETVDVSSNEITVMDLDSKRKQNMEHTDPLNLHSSLERQALIREETDICMSLVGFSGYTAFNVILVVSSAALFVAAYQKHLSEKSLSAF